MTITGESANTALAFLVTSRDRKMIATSGAPSDFVNAAPAKSTPATTWARGSCRFFHSTRYRV